MNFLRGSYLVLTSQLSNSSTYRQGQYFPQVMDLVDGGTWRKSGKLPERCYAGKGANLAGRQFKSCQQVFVRCNIRADLSGKFHITGGWLENLYGETSQVLAHRCAVFLCNNRYRNPNDNIWRRVVGQIPSQVLAWDPVAESWEIVGNLINAR